MNGGQKAQCRGTGQQEQDILLGSAETSKSGPAEKANSTPSRTVHTSNEQIPPEQGRSAGAGRRHPPLAEYNLSASLQ